MPLSDLKDIRTALFVKISVAEYYNGASLVPTDLLFSDHYRDFGLAGEDGSTIDTYTALGQLVNITNTTSDLRASGNTVSIVISGIPNTSLRNITRSKLKTSPVRILRAFFTPQGELIDDSSIENPVGRFKGFINNYSLVEEWDSEARTASNTIHFECASSIDVLAKKKIGRRTNPESQKRYFPLDRSFDRLPAIANSKYNFGG